MKLLDWLEKKGRCLVLREKDGSIYLKRYYLLFKEKTNQFEEEKRVLPFNLYLHKICRDDADDLHDHPWFFLSCILKGGYKEETPDGVTIKKPGSFSFKKPTSLHKLFMLDGVCYTLLFRGPTVRKWGFVKDGVWIPSQQYLKSR